MYQKQYDEKKIKMRAAMLVYEHHPEWSIDKKDEASLSDYWLDTARKCFVVRDFTQKIYEHNCGALTHSQSERVAFNIINEMPQELWPNIEEWIDDQPISDIKVQGISIPDIMHQFPGEDILFLSAMKCMCMWKEYGYKGKDFCKLYFARM